MEAATAAATHHFRECARLKAENDQLKHDVEAGTAVQHHLKVEAAGITKDRNRLAILVGETQQEVNVRFVLLFLFHAYIATLWLAVRVCLARYVKSCFSSHCPFSCLCHAQALSQAQAHLTQHCNKLNAEIAQLRASVLNVDSPPASNSNVNDSKFDPNATVDQDENGNAIATVLVSSAPIAQPETSTVPPPAGVIVASHSPLEESLQAQVATLQRELEKARGRCERAEAAVAVSARVHDARAHSHLVMSATSAITIDPVTVNDQVSDEDALLKMAATMEARETEWEKQSEELRRCTVELARRNNEYRRVNRLLAADLKKLLRRQQHQNRKAKQQGEIAPRPAKTGVSSPLCMAGPSMHVQPLASHALGNIARVP